MLKIEDIINIIKTVDQSSIQSFDLEHETTKISITKEGCLVRQKSIPEPAGQPLLQTSVVPTVTDQPAAGKADEESSFVTITAPLVGTFYSAPEPGAQPFVTVGQKVSENSVVCVLEAMKLFNEVQAGVAGEIVDILVNDEEFIEYGQPLFRVRPV